ncbi:si:ch211-165f21.7 isoform X2 [Danio rerio]|uniref:Si:ch211-165f21.7 isoform X2 n=2 Tax=Danio rerio TaxID=7955 RepID=A0AC58FXR3_DANRE
MGFSVPFFVLLLILCFSQSGRTQAKAIVRVSRDYHVFTGETVTLTCDIQIRGNIQWTYSWFKDGSLIPYINERVFAITSASDTGKYSCEGKISSDAVYVTVSDFTTPLTPPSNTLHTSQLQNYTFDMNETTYSDFTTPLTPPSNTLHTSQLQNSISVMTGNITYSARPKPVVKVSPDQHVFIGETVTLTCDIQTGGNIQWIGYSWIKDGDTHNPHRTTSAAELSFRAVSASVSGQYSCRGERSDSQRSDISDTLTLTVSALPRSRVTVTPDSAVFTEETVNLTCVIESDHSDWTYEWYKDRNSVNLQSDGRYTVNRDTLTIRGAAESDQGQYWCRGQRSGRPNSSQSSSAVSLSVKALPMPTLHARPGNPVFTGEPVNLKCVIESGHSDWTYEWYKNRNSVKIQSSSRQTVNRDTLTIRGAAESDQGQYQCKGQRSGRPNSSQSSSAVSLSVMPRPKPVVKVSPDQRVFTGETVTLTCVIQTRENIEWVKYSWIKDGDTNNPHRTTSAAELSFRAVSASVSGQYSCRGERSDSQRSDISDAVTLAVLALPTPTVTMTEMIILKCVIETGHSDWKYEWYKDRNGVKLQSSNRHIVNRDTLTIRGVKPDESFYECKGLIDGRSVSIQSTSFFIVKPQISACKIVFFLLAVCPFLSATVVLLFKIYKARAQSAKAQSQNAVVEELTSP